MYIPEHYKIADAAAQIEFMRQFPFATLVTSDDKGVPFATHLPVMVEVTEESLVIRAHVARQNPQWQHFDEREILVIFQEPHAYISPRWYEKTLNVPTWNYITVHAYGIPDIIEAESLVLADLEKLIHQSEPGYFSQWQALPDEYKSAMIKGIVAFSIKITRLEGKVKLSQNKTETERQRIIEGLSATEHPGDQHLGTLMQAYFTKK